MHSGGVQLKSMRFLPKFTLPRTRAAYATLRMTTFPSENGIGPRRYDKDSKRPSEELLPFLGIKVLPDTLTTSSIRRHAVSEIETPHDAPLP